MKKQGLVTQQIVAIAIGSALFGVLMNYGGIPVFTNTKLSTAYIIPVVVGALFGPIPAGLVGLIGNIFADFIGGWGYWFDWSIGNMVAAFAVGSMSLYGADIRRGIFTKKHAVIFTIVTIIGMVVAFGVVTPIMTFIIFKGEFGLTITQAWISVIANSAVAIIVGIPILFSLANRYKKQTNLTLE